MSGGDHEVTVFKELVFTSLFVYFLLYHVIGHVSDSRCVFVIS